jgi:hypothetical protein
MDIELLELVTFLNKNKTKNLEIIGQENASPSMVQEFYSKLCEKAFQTEDEAAQYFFQSDANNRNYKELKRRLKSRLLDTVLFIDVNQEGFTSYQKAYYSSQKELSAASILYYRGMYKAAAPLLLKLEKRAVKNRFMDILVQTAATLMGYYGVVLQDLKKIDHYSQLLAKANKGLFLEHKALEYITKLQILHTHQKPNLSTVNEKAKLFFEDLSKEKTDFVSHRFLIYYWNIEHIIYSTGWELEKWLNSSNQIIEFLKKEIPAFTVARLHFLKRKVDCCLLLEKYEEGLAAVEEMSNTKGKTVLSDINCNKYQIQLLLCTKQYQEAYECFIATTKKRAFSKLPMVNQEFWKIMEAYLNYFIEIEQIAPKERKRFSIGKFLNEVPKYSKEKTAGNIPILIIQILFFIHRQQYGLTVRRLETLNKYRVRYLEEGTNIRSKIFIKMLLQIPKADFKREKVKIKTKVLLQELTETNRATSKQEVYTELVPYEHLWNLLLQTLP